MKNVLNSCVLAGAIESTSALTPFEMSRFMFSARFAKSSLLLLTVASSKPLSYIFIEKRFDLCLHADDIFYGLYSSTFWYGTMSGVPAVAVKSISSCPFMLYVKSS